MNETVTFFIDWTAVHGKDRPRSTRSGHHYTPKRTMTAEARIEAAYREAHPGRAPHTGPVTMLVDAYYPIPSSAPKWRALLLPGTAHCQKPDWDNLGKLVSDGLNGVAYIDDKQVYWATVTRRYSSSASGIHVTLRFEDGVPERRS